MQDLRLKWGILTKRVETRFQEDMRDADPIEPSERRVKSHFSAFKLTPSHP